MSKPHISVMKNTDSGKSVLTLVGGGKYVPIQEGTENYTKAHDFWKEGNQEGLYSMLFAKEKQIKKYEKEGFRVEDEIVFIGSESLPATLGNRLVEFAEEGLPCRPLVNFWNRVKLNPSSDSVNELFIFLDKNRQAITEDGYFLAYKRVRDDFKDFYSGTFDNSVGQTPEMKREEVDDNRAAACSRGLHVANFHYASFKYHAGEGVLIEVRVDPADVVSIPYDHNDAKIRCTKYLVLSVCEEENKSNLVNPEGQTYVKPVESEDKYDCGDPNCVGCHPEENMVVVPWLLQVCDKCDEFNTDCMCNEDEVDHDGCDCEICDPVDEDDDEDDYEELCSVCGNVFCYGDCDPDEEEYDDDDDEDRCDYCGSRYCGGECNACDCETCNPIEEDDDFCGDDPREPLDNYPVVPSVVLEFLADESIFGSVIDTSQVEWPSAPVVDEPMPF